ncbi:MAG: hypothetical protein KBB54_00375 [Candidatus Pacebacteria bacterium]|jgi:hypothetical protein|nr:hypothetical protein [Candidatus Paceibacterota bacterium]MBP9818432.1 hypothetical protein [Candidatus Paceibacterota bacterium]
MPALSDLNTYATFIYAFLMLLYWSGTFVILYHLLRFGIGSQPKKIAVVFLAGSLILSIITTLFFAQVIFTP